MSDIPVHLEHSAAGSNITARIGIVTLSDTRTPATDKSGQLIRTLVEAAGHSVTDYRVLPDEPAELESTLCSLLRRDDVDVVLTNGGTGISRRDQTVSVVERLFDQSLPGFGELFRTLSWEQIGASAMLSRAVAGVSRGKPVFAMPGSSAAVELAVTRLILPTIGHLLRELRK